MAVLDITIGVFGPAMNCETTYGVAWRCQAVRYEKRRLEASAPPLLFHQHLGKVTDRDPPFFPAATTIPHSLARSNYFLLISPLVN